MSVAVTEPASGNTISPSLLPSGKGIAFSIAFLAEMLLIVIGNSIAFGAFTRPRQLQKRSCYLLINLTVADFLVGCVCIPLRVYILANHFELWEYQRGFEVGMAYQTLASFLEGGSILSLVMISFERVCAIVWPFKHRTLPTEVYYASVGLTWCLACIVPASDIMNTYGFISRRAALLTWLTFLASAPMLISINYLGIWIKCKFGTTPSRMASLREQKMAMSLFLVTTASMVTILPAPVTYLYFHFSQESELGCLDTCRFAYLSAQVLYYANSLVNPIIYALRMPEVRDYAMQLIRRRPQRCVTDMPLRNMQGL